ncbi:hypothetical protein GTHT12_01433 [Geobacillus thermodenitrificans]|nr:hypothetical protein GTHT12_01433 [Geobacillus thermodenitrificans]
MVLHLGSCRLFTNVKKVFEYVIKGCFKQFLAVWCCYLKDDQKFNF